MYKDLYFEIKNKYSNINFILMPNFYPSNRTYNKCIWYTNTIFIYSGIILYCYDFWMNKYNRSNYDFEYILLSDRNQPYVDRNGQSIITNASNVPYNNPTYNTINSIGRQWIFEYGLGIVKEILGYVRGKYSTIPIPGAEITLNQGDLISAATNEKQSLIERLRAYFDTTSRKTLLANKAEEAQSQMSILTDVPMTIFIG
jgi:hypothetical protein